MYEKLAKFYYKYPDEYENEYQKRINDYAAVNLDLKIKPLKANEEFQCFYVNHQGLALDYSKIMKNTNIIQAMLMNLPTSVLQHYVQSKLVDELVNTNKIEGVRSTRAEMKRVLVIETPEKKTRFWSFVNAYRSLLENASLTKVETPQMIRKIYDELLAGEVDLDDQLDGVLFRANGVDVADGSQKVIHQGVVPEEKVIASLEKMLAFLNEYPAPVLHKIVIAHYYFGYVHPFYDGNGRTSRYISSLYLKNELDILTALTLSYAIDQNKKRYYGGFADSEDRLNKGELTHFCQSFFQILLFAQEHIIDELQTKTTQLHSLFETVEYSLRNFTHNEQQIILKLGEQHLFGFTGDGLSKKEVEDALEISGYKVNKAFDVLVERGIIEVIKKKPLVVMLAGEFTRALGWEL